MDGAPNDLIEYAFVFWPIGRMQKIASSPWRNARRWGSCPRRTANGSTPSKTASTAQSPKRARHSTSAECNTGLPLAAMSAGLARKACATAPSPAAAKASRPPAFPATDFTLGGVFLSDEITLLDGVADTVSAAAALR